MPKGLEDVIPPNGVCPPVEPKALTAGACALEPKGLAEGVCVEEASPNFGPLKVVTLLESSQEPEVVK